MLVGLVGRPQLLMGGFFHDVLLPAPKIEVPSPRYEKLAAGAARLSGAGGGGRGHATRAEVVAGLDGCKLPLQAVLYATVS